MDVDDLYGDDILDFGQAHSAPENRSGPATAGRGDDIYGAHEADNSQLTSRLQQQDMRIAALEAQLAQANAQLVQQGQASQRLPSAWGASPDPQQPGSAGGSASVVASLRAQLAAKSLEVVELRRALHAARSAVDPSVMQVRQLLLDPAVEAEFARVRSELEAAQAAARRAQEDLQAVTFTADSKAGRLLMAKCRALQEENEEMGKEVAEGKVHALERQAALARQQLAAMRRAYAELEALAEAQDREAEATAAALAAARRQLDAYRSGGQALPSPPDMPGFKPSGFGNARMPGKPGYPLSNSEPAGLSAGGDRTRRHLR